MSAYNDSRLPVYFTRSQYDGGIHGGVSGDNNNGAAAPFSTTAYWSRPNMAYDSPVSFITRAEVEFFLAEYYAESGDFSNGANHYNAAIQASFASAGVSGADAAIAAYPFDSANWKRSLGVQKWVHLGCLNTFQGWCELRRLKYPSFGTTTGTDMYPGGSNFSIDTSILSPGYLYTPYQVYDGVGPDKIAQRFPYSQYSENTNEDQVPDFPGFTAPIFWAK